MEAGVSETNMVRNDRPRVASNDRIFQWVEALSELGGRLPDSPGAIAAANLIRDEFVRMGLAEVRIEEAPTVRWSAHRHALSVAGRQLPCSPVFHSFTAGMPCTFSTGPEGLRAEIVYLGSGSKADFAANDVSGKIVVCDVHFAKIRLQDHEQVLYVHDPRGEHGDDFYLNCYDSPGDTFPLNYYCAQAAGAAGYVGVLCDYYRERHSYANEAYDAYDGKPLTTPGLWVSATVGEGLKALIAGVGGAAGATLVLEGELAAATSRVVVGALPGGGPDQDETVIVDSHYDSVGPGATQDASGTAATLALAEYFSGLPIEERNRSLLFVLNDTHFSDYGAHEHFVARHLAALDPVFVVSVEHIARELVDTPAGPALTGRSAYRIIWTSPSKPVVEVVTRAVIEHDLEGAVLVSSDYDPNNLGADTNSLWATGLPVVSHLGVPTYMYDEIDTLDKVDRDQLQPTVAAFVDIIRGLDKLPRMEMGRGKPS
jgi:hypothetical protein